MKIVQLKTDTELCQFQKETYKYLKVVYPLEFLKPNLVRGIFSDDQQMIGGYIVAITPPFRSLDLVPPKALQASSIYNKLDLDSVLEINGLWLSPLASNRLYSVRTWFRLYQDIISSPKKHLVYVYDQGKEKLGKLYSACDPQTIYAGKTLRLAGIEEDEYNVVQIAPIDNLSIKQAGHFLLKKMMRKRGLCHNLSYHIQPTLEQV